MNLRERLSRIRKAAVLREPPQQMPPPSQAGRDTDFSDWEKVGDSFCRRSVLLETVPTPQAITAALSILVPDLRPLIQSASLPSLENLLFFDLETTGLSGGAGTLAFLAGFAGFLPGRVQGQHQFEVRQYLLLDYPGESGFLEAVLAEITRAACLVSFNGKTFDTQILKSRCIMNGLHPPPFMHVDLLHPSRRLWKRVLPSCSQAAIETQVLGLDRSGDLSGALAPAAWFDFLKAGSTALLLDVCEHNRKDISGLAHLFAAFTQIAAAPLDTILQYRLDVEALALDWSKTCRSADLDAALFCTGRQLLTLAANNGHPRAALALGRTLLKEGEAEAGRALLLSVRNNSNGHHNTKALALRALAIDAERQFKDKKAALDFTEEALTLIDIRLSIQADFIRRKQRLERKGRGAL
ncbi:ribonuclease H-like domain-containing protein [Breznakiellaceae bacterium SP9]